MPRPIHRPVEVWQPIASGRTVEYIAQKGIKAVVALTGERLVEKLFRTYREAAARAGRQLIPGQDIALGIGFCIADSQAAAIEKIQPYHDERYKWFAPLRLRLRYTDSEGRPWWDPRRPDPGAQYRRWCGSEGLVLRAVQWVC